MLPPLSNFVFKLRLYQFCNQPIQKGTNEVSSLVKFEKSKKSPFRQSAYSQNQKNHKKATNEVSSLVKNKKNRF